MIIPNEQWIKFITKFSLKIFLFIVRAFVVEKLIGCMRWLILNTIDVKKWVENCFKNRSKIIVIYSFYQIYLIAVLIYTLKSCSRIREPEHLHPVSWIWMCDNLKTGNRNILLNTLLLWLVKCWCRIVSSPQFYTRL